MILCTLFVDSGKDSLDAPEDGQGRLAELALRSSDAGPARGSLCLRGLDDGERAWRQIGNVLEPAADLLQTTIVAGIGPVTAKVAAQHGIQTSIVPEAYTVPALVDAIAEYFKRHPDGEPRPVGQEKRAKS
mgnify:CR=1 FL=1